MSCQERDKIILAFMLAMNEGNYASSELEAATDQGERDQALRTMESARGYCDRLRTQVLTHCLQHGC
ncbi:MAG TPA: hypothetical protein VKU19_22425 [Bryobacteraceae bacterium]|nr:hypothetical protein [Bryobacteraceae bacterium]